MTSPGHPRCFLHVAKSGGTSVQLALRAALPAGAINLKTLDTSTFCCGFTAFDEVREQQRETVLLSDDELDAMSQSAVVSGHFSLPTLLRIAPAGSIATVLREPRARLISVYAFWRLAAEHNKAWLPYRAYAHAMRPLDEFLSEPQLAPGVDNCLCRMLLYGDPRVPELAFIAADDIQSLASDAISELDRLGFVGVLEREQTMWEGVSRFFGVPLDPLRVNETGSARVAPGALPLQRPISEQTLDLFDSRTAADALVYAHVLSAQSSEAVASAIRESAFAAQLVRLGDLTGNSAASSQVLTQRLSDAEAQLADLVDQLSRCQQDLDGQHRVVEELEQELARNSSWLKGMQDSVSWRITSPLRAAKRRLM